MKNKHGFTLIELLAVIVVLGIIMLIAVTAVNNIINNTRTDAFIKDEKILIKATQNYLASGVVNYPSNIGDTVEVKLSDLRSNGFIEPIKSPSNQSVECDGYLIVTKIETGQYDYTPHLDCVNGIGSATEDGLMAHYTFDDFQEPTENLLIGNLISTDSIKNSHNGWQSTGISADNPRKSLLSNTISMQATTKYTFSCLYWSGNNIVGDVFLGFSDTGWPESTYYIQPFISSQTNQRNGNTSVTDLGDGWKYLAGTFETLSTTTTLNQIFFDADLAGVTVFISDLQLEKKNICYSFC